MTMFQGLRLPRVDGKKLGRSWLLRTAQRNAELEVWPFLDEIGAERFQRIIESNIPLHDLIKPEKLPEDWVNFLASAPQYNWVLKLWDDKDLLTLLPPWLQQLINQDEKSMLWYVNEAKWLRSLFEPKGDQNGESV
ncbi:MAG TPA: hypothetical protein VMW00_06375 [Dehalococcoidales bacterium]|nr:hypothetical protein [Dehalococcoidales bacterium]